MSSMMKFIFGRRVRVKDVNRDYAGTAVGASPTRVYRTGEPADQYMITVKCSTCGVCDVVPERYVSDAEKAAEKEEEVGMGEEVQHGAQV